MEIILVQRLKKIQMERKRKRSKPLETKEMETELLSTNDMNEFKLRNTPQSRISRLGIDPYDPFNNTYNNVNNNMNYNMSNNYPVGPNNPFNHPYSMYHYIMNDPDYKDFLIYKKMKNNTNNLYEPFVNKTTTINDDFDQLLLYIFTGIFILIMFDNVYKLGINL